MYQSCFDTFHKYEQVYTGQEWKQMELTAVQEYLHMTRKTDTISLDMSPPSLKEIHVWADMTSVVGRDPFGSLALRLRSRHAFFQGKGSLQRCLMLACIFEKYLQK